MIFVYHQPYRLSHHDRTTTFDSCPIQCIHLGNEITVHFADGATAQWHCRWAEPGYLSQFGIAASADGRYVFIQTWENGLFCLCSHTGTLLWRTESKRGITNIYVNHDTILCHQRERALQLIDIHTGNVLQEKRPATSWGFTALDHKHILCQVSAKRWEIIDAQTLEVVESFTHKEFTGGHTDYCIQSIQLLDDGKLLIQGFKNIWDTSKSPAIRLPNLEFTHFLQANTLLGTK